MVYVFGHSPESFAGMVGFKNKTKKCIYQEKVTRGPSSATVAHHGKSWV